MPEPRRRPARRERLVSPAFALLWCASLAFFSSFFLLLPALPVYARQLGIPDAQIGLIIGLFAVSSMLMRPVAGWGADRWGRRPPMLLGALLFLVSSLLYGASVTVTALLAVRLLHGAGMGFFPTAAATMVADLAPPARRGEAMGLAGAAANVAMALGPLVGVWLADRWGFLVLFWISGGLAFLALGLVGLQRDTLRPDPIAVVIVALAAAAPVGGAELPPPVTIDDIGHVAGRWEAERGVGDPGAGLRGQPVDRTRPPRLPERDHRGDRHPHPPPGRRAAGAPWTERGRRALLRAPACSAGLGAA